MKDGMKLTESIFARDRDIEVDDAVPVGGEGCGYGGKEAGVVEFDSSRGRSIEDE